MYSVAKTDWIFEKFTSKYFPDINSGKACTSEPNKLALFIYYKTITLSTTIDTLIIK